MPRRDFLSMTDSATLYALLASEEPTTASAAAAWINENAKTWAVPWSSPLIIPTVPPQFPLSP